MDPSIIPAEPATKQADGRAFYWFKKHDWSRQDIETYLEGKHPGYVKSTWFDQVDTHKIVVELPRLSHKPV